MLYRTFNTLLLTYLYFIDHEFFIDKSCGYYVVVRCDTLMPIGHCLSLEDFKLDKIIHHNGAIVDPLTNIMITYARCGNNYVILDNEDYYCYGKDLYMYCDLINIHVVHKSDLCVQDDDTIKLPTRIIKTLRQHEVQAIFDKRLSKLPKIVQERLCQEIAQR